MNDLSHMITLLAQGSAPGGGGSELLLMMILMFVIMYFVLIRPQRKRQKELEQKIAALKSGDRVITAGGMHGMVTNVKDRTIILKVADNVKLEFEKSSVATTIPKSGDEKGKAKGSEAETAELTETVSEK